MALSRQSTVRLRLERLEDREMPSASPWSVESFDNLTAPNLPTGWTQWTSSSGENTFATSSAKAYSGGNSLATDARSNVSGRIWENAVVPADSGVQANLFAGSLVPAQLIARGQHLDTATPTYYAVEITRGLNVDLTRVVNGVSTTIGSLKSQSYFSQHWVHVRLTFAGDQIAVQVVRDDTGQYLDGKGNWVALATSALQVKDAAIAAGGEAGIGRVARYAGPVYVDDFAILPAAAPIVAENFNAAPAGSVPSGWSRWSNDGTVGIGVSAAQKIDGLGLTSSGGSASANRAWENAVLPGDVRANASIFLNSLIPAQVFVRGSNLNGNTPSYYAVSVTSGVDISLVRMQNGVGTELANLLSTTYTGGFWANVSLTAQGSHLQVRVQRADTGQWLNDRGIWQTDPAAAIDAVDTSITAGGQAGLARPASYAGNVSFDNFSVLPAGDITAPAVQYALPNQGHHLSGLVSIPVSASDANGVVKVDYLVDDLLVAERTTGPWDWALDTRNFSSGSHLLTIRAWDSAGNLATHSLLATFANAASSLPAIPSHYAHIRLANLAYYGNPLGTFEQNLLKNSVDLVIPDTRTLSTIAAVAPNTPQLIYTNLSNIYQELLTDWLAYADAHGTSREQAFYHVTQPTAFTGASGSSQPVGWFWNAALGPVSGTTGFKNLTDAAHGATAGGVSFGAAGQALNLGYTDKFREINFNLARAKRSGWSSIVEYVSGVDVNGSPIWKTLTLNSDATNGFSRSGQLIFDPPKDWAAAAVPGSSAPLYYIRIRTLAGDSSLAPIAGSILGRDYVDAHGGSSGTIPVFDYAADKNGDGYLNDAEYANRAAGDNARFAYESRLFYPYYGQMRFVVNPSAIAVQTWAADFEKRLLQSNPLAAGLFLDNSSGVDPIAGIPVKESTAAYTSDYASLLATLERTIAPKWAIANTSNGGPGTDQVVKQLPATLEESAIRALAQNWQQFNGVAATVAERQSAASPTPYLVLDTLSTGGSPTDPRTQLATLSYYYLISNPKTTFLMLFGGEEPASSWTRHFFNALAYNVGQPQGNFSLFATGRDPSNAALTYNVYQRQYSNALVLYKPLSYANGHGSGSTAANTATTHALNGTYRVLHADGTLGATATSISLRNGEGAVLIKA